MRAHLRLCLALVTLAACPRNEEIPPIDETGSDTSTTTMTPTTTDPTIDPDTTVGEESSSTGGDACVGPNGCYDCEPTQSEQLLNRCTESECEPFPITTERLPLLEADGSLPPIP